MDCLTLRKIKKPEMSERDKLKEEMKAVTSKGKTNENDKTIEK